MFPLAFLRDYVMMTSNNSTIRMTIKMPMHQPERVSAKEANRRASVNQGVIDVQSTRKKDPHLRSSV